jgi:Ca2+-binding EF-hand superfamily protein
VHLTVVQVQSVFVRFDTDGSGVIDAAEFKAGYEVLFPDAEPGERERVFAWMDTQVR